MKQAQVAGMFGISGVVKQAEVCDVLGIDSATLRHLVRTGELPGLVAGYWVLVREKDLEEYIARKLPAGTP